MALIIVDSEVRHVDRYPLDVDVRTQPSQSGSEHRVRLLGLEQLD
jgi:hypothetical protein